MFWTLAISAERFSPTKDDLPIGRMATRQKEATHIEGIRVHHSPYLGLFTKKAVPSPFLMSGWSCCWTSVTHSSVLRLDKSIYYAYFYLKGSINCPMSIKLSRKFYIGVISLPKYFATHFGHVTLKQLITLISFTQKWGTYILQNFENVWH